MTSAPPLPCDPDAARARVRWVLEASARLADGRDPIGREARALLPSATGLSPEGVELALCEHLEASADEDALAALINAVPPAPCTHVVLAANVFVGAVRALCLALAASPRVRVRPSRREPLFASLLIRALSEAGHGEHVALTEALSPERGDAVHAYGSDRTMDAIEAALPEGTTLWKHGSGLGVALVDGRDMDAAERIARDVVPFDQRGCLSPRFVFFSGSERAARALSERLADALRAWAVSVPLGAVDPTEHAARRAYLDTMTLVGEVHAGAWGAVTLDLAPRALLLPSGPRVVHVARIDEPASARSLLSSLATYVTCVGGGLAAAPLAASLQGSRRAELGFMQRPPLDGPVDQRTRPYVKQ